MKMMHGKASHLRMIGRCALTGVLTGLLATQSFAQGGALRVDQTSHDTNAAAAPQPMATETSAQSPAPKLMAALELSALPEAPAPVQPAAAVDDPASQNMVASTPSKTTKSHKVRPGWIALGIAGAGAAAMGAYIFSLNAKNTTYRNTLGTIFLAPGAAAAGLGFYFAFKK